MPHIVIEGMPKLETFFKIYAPSSHTLPNGALKLQHIFINPEKNCILIEAIAAEGGPPNCFLVQVLQPNKKTTVKIYPGSDTEKTPGVKKLLALVAHQFITNFTGTTYGPTNLKEYLL
jgi:hypothetical protein